MIQPTYGVIITQVDRTIIIVIRTDRKTTSPIETGSTVPVQDKDTLGYLWVHLVSHDRGIQEPLGFHLILSHKIRVLIDLLKVITGRKKSSHRYQSGKKYISLEGKSHKEIAEELHIAITTIKKHKTNANNYLRERLKGLLCFMMYLGI